MLRNIKVNTIYFEDLTKSLQNSIQKEYDYIAKEGDNYIFYRNTLRVIPELLPLFLEYGKESDILVVTRLYL